MTVHICRCHNSNLQIWGKTWQLRLHYEDPYQWNCQENTYHSYIQIDRKYELSVCSWPGHWLQIDTQCCRPDEILLRTMYSETQRRHLVGILLNGSAVTRHDQHFQQEGNSPHGTCWNGWDGPEVPDRDTRSFRVIGWKRRSQGKLTDQQLFQVKTRLYSWTCLFCSISVFFFFFFYKVLFCHIFLKTVKFKNLTSCTQMK